jgi:hypothetical protein
VYGVQCQLSEKDSNLSTGNISTITAIVDFRGRGQTSSKRPPTLGTLRDLLVIIREKAQSYNLRKVLSYLDFQCQYAQISHYNNHYQENCWFYATAIQENLTDWCNGNRLYGTLPHQGFARETREIIRNEL